MSFSGAIDNIRSVIETDAGLEPTPDGRELALSDAPRFGYECSYHLFVVEGPIFRQELVQSPIHFETTFQVEAGVEIESKFKSLARTEAEKKLMPKVVQVQRSLILDNANLPNTCAILQDLEPQWITLDGKHLVWIAQYRLIFEEPVP